MKLQEKSLPGMAEAPDLLLYVCLGRDLTWVSHVLGKSFSKTLLPQPFYLINDKLVTYECFCAWSLEGTAQFLHFWEEIS